MALSMFPDPIRPVPMQPMRSSLLGASAPKTRAGMNIGATRRLAKRRENHGGRIQRAEDLGGRDS